MQKVNNIGYTTLSSIVAGRSIYKLTDLAIEEVSAISLIQSSGNSSSISSNAFKILNDVIYFESDPNDGEDYVKVFGRLENKRCYRFIKEKYINQPSNFKKFKIILPKANGTGAIGEVLSTPLIGEPLIGEPLIGYTDSFIAIGEFKTRTEAEFCMKYIKSKFARTMLGILKVTQDNPAPKWEYVPMQNFTANSDINWSTSIREIDKQLYNKYGLSQEEINFIEEKVKTME